MQRSNMVNSALAERVPKWQAISLAMLLCAATGIAYANSLLVPFLFDDLQSVLANSSIRDLWTMHWLHPAAAGTVGGRPLVNLTFALNYQIGGISPVGYHLGNLLLHFLSALIIFAWLTELLSTTEIPEQIRKVSAKLAFICALLWACHPVNTYTVTYISQRSEALMSFCYLTVLYIFWKWMGPETNRRLPYLAVFVCFCGMASKEGMATAPIMVLLLDRTFFAKSFIGAIKTRRFFYLGLASSWLLLLALYTATRGRGVGFGQGITAAKYALTESRVVLLYLKLVIVPHPLVFDYFYTVYRRNIEELPYLFTTISVLSATAVLLWKRPLLGFAFSWFFLLLLPSSSFIPIASQPMGENRVYLASLGPIVLVSVLIYYFLRSFGWILFSIIACVFIQLTEDRNDQCLTPIRIWLDTTVKVPTSPRAFCNLGEAFLEEDRLDEADLAINRAIDLYPAWSEPLGVKGDILLKRGNRRGAEEMYRLGLEQENRNGLLWRKIGAVLADRGELNEARNAFLNALKLNPDDPLAFVGLGNVALNRGEDQNALSFYLQAIAVNCDVAVAHNDLGYVYLKQGRTNEATEEFAQAVYLEPDLPKPQANLATMYARTGNYERAIWHYLYALRLSPHDLEIRTNLGLAYQLSGRLSTAESCYREVLRQDPKDGRAAALLKQLKAGISVPQTIDSKRAVPASL